MITRILEINGWTYTLRHNRQDGWLYVQSSDTLKLHSVARVVDGAVWKYAKIQAVCGATNQEIARVFIEATS